MKLFFSIFLTIFLFASNAKSAPIIRDAELEIAIRLVANPIFKTVGYKPEDIQIYIVNSDQINAYVSGGKNIFIYTGLLSIAKDPNMLAGVIAHETGHIVGGHLLKGEEEARTSMVKSTVGYMLGLAAAAAGSPQAGAAIASGTQQVVERQALKYSRGHEEAADQSGLNSLDKAGLSAKGMLEMMEVLYGKEVAMYSNINPYMLTHPLSRERVDHIRAHLLKSPFANNMLSQDITNRYIRAIVKLDAFLKPTAKTLKKYPITDKSVNARYARAIAYYKIPDLTHAIAEIDSLIKQFPSDPFFIELKGQILFENGKLREAITYYDKSEALLSGSALFKIQLATVQISSEDSSYLKSAIANLEQALRIEKNNTFAWHQLGVAYGKQGQLDMSNIALAEEALLMGDKETAKKFIGLSKKYIKPGSPAELRLKDIEGVFVDKK